MNNDSIVQANSVFEQPWWLEALSPGMVGEAKVIRDEKIVARLPYTKRKKYGVKCICLPPWTPFAGPWIQKTSDRMAYRIGYEKEILYEIIDSLPRKMSIDLRICPEQFYYLPFKWRGFQIIPQITYRIEDISNIDEVWNNIHKGTRAAIRKAEKILTVRDDMPIDCLFEMLKMTFDRQNRSDPTDEETFRRLDKACREHNASKFLCALDTEGHVHTATYYVYDSNVIYALAGGSDPRYRNSQSDAFLIWEAIKFASGRIKAFDFEGSQIESIERFFRSFGGKPLVYFEIKKQLWYHNVLDSIKPKIKNILGYK